MYGVFGIHFLASTTSSFPMSARSSRGGEIPRAAIAWGRNSKGRYRVRGEILVSCSLCSHFSMYRLPKHSAPNRRNICFRCFRILFGYVLLRFPSHFPLLYLAPFHRATSGRRPREQRHNSPPTKSDCLLTKPEKGWLDYWYIILKNVLFWLVSWKGWLES